jgi:protein-arginine kinase activator protein McsA
MVRCKKCGGEFSPQDIYHRVCDECYWAWRHGSGWAECADCGAEFAQQRPEHKHCHRCYQNRRPVLPVHPQLRGHEYVFTVVYVVLAAAVLMGLLHWLGATLGWW